MTRRISAVAACCSSASARSAASDGVLGDERRLASQRRDLVTNLPQLGPELLDRRGVVSHHAPPKAPAPPTAVGVRLRAGGDGRRHYRPPIAMCQGERGTPASERTTGKGRGAVMWVTGRARADAGPEEPVTTALLRGVAAGLASAGRSRRSGGSPWRGGRAGEAGDKIRRRAILVPRPTARSRRAGGAPCRPVPWQAPCCFFRRRRCAVDQGRRAPPAPRPSGRGAVTLASQVIILSRLSDRDALGWQRQHIPLLIAVRR